MQRLTPPQPWTQQPQFAVGGVSPYWLSRGLQMVFDGRKVVFNKRNLSGAVPTVIGVKNVVSIKGVASGFGATYGTATTDRIDSNAILDSPTSGSRSVVAQLYANSQGGGGLGRVFQSSVGSGVATAGDEGVYYIGTGSMSIVRTGSNLVGTQYVSTAFFTYGSWRVFGSSWLFDYPTNTLPTMFFDGMPTAVTAQQVATAAYPGATSIGVSFGNRADNTRNWDGMIGAVLIFDGYLTPLEHAALAANPWQVFSPAL